MVASYDPLQLVRTGIDVAISTIFGRHSDQRLIEALAAQSAQAYDYSQETEPGSDFWIDYAGDVGDGFDSTYAIAYAIAREALPLIGPGGEEHVTQRGRVLIFGGDQVYPVANRAEYERRLVYPYETALHRTDPPHPDVFAIPGNHDWYDSLVSFTRLFSSRAWFGGWRTRQCRSYFALKLPHQWWLIGTDVQLASDIDAPQVSYFREVAKQMEPGDRIILCNAEPHWIYAKIYGQDDENYTENNLAFLESKVFHRKISVFLAGDLHHYRRHADDSGAQKITAGGGGAFLHPTHGPSVSELADGFKLKSSFPPADISKRLAGRNFLFPVLNPRFGLLTGLLYLITAWSTMADVGKLGISQWWSAVKVALNGALNTPIAAFWGIALFFGFVLFTDTHSRVYRWIAGPLHGLGHVIACFCIGWWATYIGERLGLQFGQTKQLLLAGVILFAGGWLAGSAIMGVYLYISLNWFQRHTNEAFSSLAIPDWKNFLRLKIDSGGRLTIYPIGIRRVPRKWQAAGAFGPGLVPDDPKATAPELIETPVVLN